MPQMTTTIQTSSIGPETGYASHFEARPEHLFGQLLPLVVDASSVREHPVGDLKVFKIAEVFTGASEIFLGFGKPNTYLVVPNGEGGYRKFAGKSLRRAPSVVEETRGFVQSGILIRFTGLPEEAAEALRKAMANHHGEKFWTCVNANLRVMEEAGFAAGPKPLSKIYFPYALLRTLVTHGLTFEGKPVEFQVIRTTPMHLERYTTKIIKAELTTIQRHALRNLDALEKKSRVVKALRQVTRLPGRLLGSLGKQSEKGKKKAPVAPALPASPDTPYCRDLNVRISEASSLGMLLRLIWGPHTLFEATQNRVDPGAYLAETLEPFPQKNPSLATRIKKRVLFARPVIAFIRMLLVKKYTALGARSEADIYNMLRTDSPACANKYNLVLTSKRIIISRLTVQLKLIDWILSKHVLVSGYDPGVVFAGEIWKGADGIIYISANSGTYRPSDEQLEAALAYMSALFPHLTFRAFRPEVEIAQPAQ